jgi:hypothetical protein
MDGSQVLNYLMNKIKTSMIRQKKIILSGIALAMTMVLILASCNKNKCKDQFCMNGGICVEGTCECDAGYFGEHCEGKHGYVCKNGSCVLAEDEGDYATLTACNAECGKGYVCLQGVCTYTNTNATYSTSSECEQSCMPVSGYRCINGVCTYTNLNATYATQSACENACGAKISFFNKGLTYMEIKFNNQTKNVYPNETVTFTGTPGAPASGTATTFGTFSSGQPLGEIVTIALNYNYPSSGTFTYQVNIPPSYYYLKIKNSGLYNIGPFVMNSGLVGQMTINGNQPPDNSVYGFGYFKAYSNSNVVATINSGSQTFTWYQGTGDFILPFTNNQSVTLIKY